MMSIPFVAGTIVGVNLLIGAAGLWVSKLPVRYGLAVDKVLTGNEYGRLWSTSWIHTHWSHLLLNTLMLSGMGFGIHWPFGAIEFLFLYLTSQLGGNLLTLYTYREDRSGQYDAIGSAGGISGVLFAGIALQPSLAVSIPMLGSLPTWPLTIAFVVASVFALKPYSGTMIHDAHLGGAVVGLLTSPLIAPEVLQETLGIAVGILVPTVGLFYTWVKAPENIVPYSWQTPPPSKLKETRELTTTLLNANLSDETVEDEMNVLLDKINRQGYRSLSEYEQARLHCISGESSPGLA